MSKVKYTLQLQNRHKMKNFCLPYKINIEIAPYEESGYLHNIIFFCIKERI